jgi:hypothetical protein
MPFFARHPSRVLASIRPGFPLDPKLQLHIRLPALALVLRDLDSDFFPHLVDDATKQSSDGPYIRAGSRAGSDRQHHVPRFIAVDRTVIPSFGALGIANRAFKILS